MSVYKITKFNGMCRGVTACVPLRPRIRWDSPCTSSALITAPGPIQGLYVRQAGMTAPAQLNR